MTATRCATAVYYQLRERLLGECFRGLIPISFTVSDLTVPFEVCHGGTSVHHSIRKRSCNIRGSVQKMPPRARAVGAENVCNVRHNVRRRFVVPSLVAPSVPGVVYASYS